ncbi:MAG: heavy metal translocating P-type ATPase [Gemmatirosa sp.]
MGSTEALPFPGARAGSAAAADVLCTHCSGPVAPADVEAGADRQFCCGGCHAAFALLHDAGLDGYYARSERADAPVRPSGRSYEEFDHEAFRALYVRRGADEVATVELYLEGVHCGSCVWLVERVPLLLPGVVRAELNLRRALARVEWDDAAVPLSQVARTLDGLGYRAHPFRGVKAEAVRRHEDREALARIGVAGAIAINVMLAALALYSDRLGGMDAGLSALFRWVSLGLTALTLAWPGRVFFTGAVAAVRTRTLNMDAPIAIALAAGLARGAVNTVRDAGPIYFDGLATLTFALLAGRYLQRRGQRAAADAAELQYSLTPSSARVVRDGAVHDVPAEALLPGMLLDVRAGDTLAADGDVEAGASTIDLSLLTGESRPVGVAPGARVYAGTVNVSAPLRVRVTGAGETSRLASILRQVEEAMQRRTRVVQLANRLAGWFAAVVLALTAATLAFWWRTSPSAAVDHAIALLVVTCPCALALATPLAVSVAVGRAARAGILVKGGDVVEQLARPGRLLLDKTGTLTQGRTALVAWAGPAWVRPLVLALEAGSMHPVAEGFRRAWPDVGPADGVDAAHTIGGGIAGTVDGRAVIVGSPRFVRERARGEPPALPRADALTPVLVAVDGAIVAAAGFGDALRPDARAAVDALRRRGWDVGILSGDDPRAVADVARALGLPPERCVGGATPEDKRRVVEEAAAAGRVVMVGDGVNDAAAIAAASVGVGVHGGAEACLGTADVYLARPGLAPLVVLMEGAERTMFVIRRNVWFSIGYNVVGAGLAMAGLLTPLVAAVLMPLSSLTVVLASWRSTTFPEDAA